MSSKTQAPVNATTKPSLNADKSGLLQRQCACGNSAGLTGKCATCQKEKLTQQRKQAATQDDVSEVPPIAHEVLSLPRIMQAKLTIGASDDPLEREADQVADQVMAAPSHPSVSDAPPRIQRFTGQSTEQADMAAPASVDSVLSSPGRPLELTLQQDMEQRFGHDFSQVRVHTDAAAERSARDVNANAYTVGHKIVFGADRFAPGTYEGRRLLAHELTHVVQQDVGTVPLAGTSVPRSLPSPQRGAKSGSLQLSPSRQVLRRSLAGCQELLANPGPPSSRIAGILIHKALLAFFMSTVPGAVRIYIPGATANPQRTLDPKTIKPEKIGSVSPNAGKGTPDLATLNAGGVLQVAELKPANLDQLLEGETQVATRYIDQGNASDEPQEAWRRSKGIKVVSPMLPHTFSPPSLFFPQPDFIIEVVFRWCQSGVLAYQLRAHRRPDEKRERVRVPEKVPEIRKGREQVPQTAPEALGHPGSAPTPVTTPGQSPAPVPPDGGKVIPFPGVQSPGTKPGKEELPIAAKSAGERILDFIEKILVNGEHMEKAVEQFLKDNPEIVKNIKVAVAAIAAGAIVSDIVSLGAAAAKDPAVVAILAAMLRIAEALEAH